MSGSWSPAGINKTKPLCKVTRAPLPNSPTHRGGREMSHWSARESSRWTGGNRTSSSLLRDGGLRNRWRPREPRPCLRIAW